jgi:general secretion pathway protein K
MKARARKKAERGVALILVLGSIAILAVMLTEFQDDTSSELAAALSERDALKAEYLARSSINLSRLLIAAEPTIRRAASMFLPLGRLPQIPVWAFADRILGAFNDKESAEGFESLTGTSLSSGKNLGIEGGRFETAIVDEDSKLDINLAARGDWITAQRLATQLLALMGGDQYSPLFEQRDRDDQFSDRGVVCGAIIDWADPDEDIFPCDLPTLTGATPSTKTAEDSFYQLLKVPYFRKNSAYDSLEELHLVRGIGDDFWATFVDPDPNKPDKRVLTVWGQGAINVNRANAQTLLSVVCSNAGAPTAKICTDFTEMQKFITAVMMFQAVTNGIPIFGSSNDFIRVMQGQGQGPMGQALAGIFKAIGIEPLVFKSATELGKAVSTDSKVFSIYAEGIVPSYRHKTSVKIHAVVDFRAAPAPGNPLGLPGMPGGSGMPVGADGGVVAPPAPAPTGAFGAGVAAAAGASSDAFASVLAPDPGGTIIYFRME